MDDHIMIEAGKEYMDRVWQNVKIIQDLARERNKLDIKDVDEALSDALKEKIQDAKLAFEGCKKEDSDYKLIYEKPCCDEIHPCDALADRLSAFMNEPDKEKINSPLHYKGKTLEAIDVIEEFGYEKNFYRANALKYLLRAGKKGDAVTDLKKAIWYIQREIDHG